MDDRSKPSEFKLVSLYTEDVLKAGILPVNFRVYYTMYSLNFVTSDNPFTITMIDPCDKPASLTSSSLSNLEYTLTDS